MADSPDFIPYQEAAPDFIPFQAEAHVPTEAEAAAHPPVAPMPKTAVRPMKNIAGGFKDEVPPEIANQKPLGAPIMPLAGAMVGPARMTASLAGGYLGSEGGEWVGERYLPEKLQPWARDIGGILGGVAAGIRAPGESPEVPETRTLPEQTPAAGPPPTPKPTAPLSDRQIGQRITQGVQEAAGTTPSTPIFRRPQGTVGAQTVGEQPNVDIAGPRIQTPSRTETMTENLKNRVPGSNPLEARVPLEEQPASPARTAAQPKEETVHPMDRQFIHVNGSRLMEAAKPELRNDLLDLEGNQIREVLRKSGEDMTHIQKIGSPTMKAPRGGTFTDPNTITRQEAFDILLDKGYTPEQILKEAPPRSRPAGVRVPFGPPR